MATPSLGAQHYILLLLPSLLSEIERLGLRHVINRSSLTERDITSLYFEAKLITRLLPDNPAEVDPALWEELLPCVQLITLMVGEASCEEREKAKEAAITNCLPRARENLRLQYQRRRQDGRIDFRLASASRPSTSQKGKEATCMEALKLERQQRYQTMMQVTTDNLNSHQAIIVSAAKAYVQHHMKSPPEDFGSLDLLITLVDLVRQLVAGEKRRYPDNADTPLILDINQVVMGIGNVLYCIELQLRRQRPADDHRASSR